MTNEEIINQLRSMAKYPTVTMPRDTKALRLAADLLEQAEQAQPVDWEAVAADQAMTIVMMKLEQEPFCYHDGRNIVGKEFADHSDVFPLYTTPPPRQPLTDEQLRDALRSCPHDTVENLRVRWLYAKDFARAIEAAHGIKGQT